MNAIRIAKSAGFDSLNLDLMYGLPRQQPDQAMEDLDHALSFSPGHLSWYQLTIEPNTLFYKNTPPLPSEDDLWSMQEEGGALLKTAGLRNYEISAYAREGYQCRHNLNYWEFGDYIGIGAGAHSKLTDCENGAILRTVRHRLPDRFTRLAGDAGVITERKVLTDTDIVLEFMMNALRLAGGFTHELFESRTGIPVGGIMDVLASASDKGWLEVNQTEVKPTAAGRNYLNNLLQCFMSDQDDKPDKLHTGVA
jgi:oxygen-independent coproporphyrinogen-3 oxidase